jgi:hypothetical protein
MKFNFIFIALFLLTSKTFGQSIMNEDLVWRIIDTINQMPNLDNKEKELILAEKLSHLSDEDIVHFDLIIYALHSKANTWDLVAVDKVFSDDAHYDFPYALISLGKIAYYEILKKPDAILDYISDSLIQKPHGFYFDKHFVRADALKIKYPYDFQKLFKLHTEIQERLKKQNFSDIEIIRGDDDYHGYKAKTYNELQERMPKIWKTFENNRDLKRIFYSWVNDD